MIFNKPFVEKPISAENHNVKLFQVCFINKIFRYIFTIQVQLAEDLNGYFEK